MKNMYLTLRSPALISLLLIIPFVVMEIVNRREFNEGFPFPLFIIMWVLPLLFIFIGMSIVQNFRRAGNYVPAKPVLLLIRVVILILIAWFWSALLIDQMPCFLGVPNCD